jgi:hypothetical protein
VNLIDFDILRIRTAEQREFKESSLASWMEKKDVWCSRLVGVPYVFFQEAYKKKGKFEARLLSLFTFS